MFLINTIYSATCGSNNTQCSVFRMRMSWFQIKRNKDLSQDFVFVQASMAMWLLLTHPVQFCILSIIINLGVDNHTNEKWNTQSATFTIGPIRTCNTIHLIEMNKCSQINRNVNLNQHKSIYHQNVTKTLSEVYIISFCFDSVPEVSCFYQL